jgi:hypothetical protein
MTRSDSGALGFEPAQGDGQPRHDRALAGDLRRDLHDVFEHAEEPAFVAVAAEDAALVSVLGVYLLEPRTRVLAAWCYTRPDADAAGAP